MIDLSDGTLWLKVFEKQYTAQSIFEKPGKFKPISSILLPGTFNIHNVAVGCYVNNAKETWHYGGEVYQSIQISNDSDIGYLNMTKKYQLRINEATLIQFEKYSVYFRILILLPDWFSNTLIKVWVYKGNGEDLAQQFNTEEIQQRLERIEYKIDNQYMA